MTEDLNGRRRDIITLFSSLRHSTEILLLSKQGNPEAVRKRFTRTMMIIEEARIGFNSYARFDEEEFVANWERVREDLIVFVDRVLNSGEIEPKVLSSRFRVTGAPRERENSPFTAHLRDQRSLTIEDALRRFKDYLQSSPTAIAPQKTFTFGDLNRIVPRQQVAPVQFDVADGILHVMNRPPRFLEGDRNNINSAIEHIKKAGNDLIQNLQTSNCDPRLLESAREVQSQILSEGNIVRIGLSNMALGIMSAQYHCELPDAILGMLNSYNASVSLYIAQFPEWQQFTEKAATIELSEAHVREVDKAAGAVIDALEKSPELADPDVPKTIAYVRNFLSFPGASSKRAAFAMIRTIENLVSSLLRYSVDFVTKTAERTVETGSTVTSRVIVSLLGIALIAASGIGPAASTAGVPWVKQVVDIVKKQIEKAME